MLETDVAIVGGGLAGSTAAAMLGRAGVDAVLVDPHTSYPPDFRCEKLDASQVKLLKRTGLADAVLKKGAPDREVWIVRHGRVVEKRKNHQYGILYDDLVNTMRGAIPPATKFIQGKAAGILNNAHRQRLTLSSGEEISARLVVMANGLNSALRQNLGMTREDISPGHSVAIGFDVAPLGREKFEFSALTWYPETPTRRIAYLTLFPVPSGMRANLFVYLDQRDPWLSRMRHTPRECLDALPGFSRIVGDYEVSGRVHIRPVDLYVTRGFEQPGIVLVGDAFATSCPAAGTGANKVFSDVDRLCNVHIPRWLRTPGMGEAKIRAFYADPEKRASDAHSIAKAHRLKALSTSTAFPWRARRLTRLVGQLGVAALRGRARYSTAAG